VKSSFAGRENRDRGSVDDSVPIQFVWTICTLCLHGFQDPESHFHLSFVFPELCMPIRPILDFNNHEFIVCLNWLNGFISINQLYSDLMGSSDVNCFNDFI
jgi:hypothetical protein